jgi:hypothetical protein
VFTYTLRYENGFLIVDLPEGPYRVDTGSPLTFGRRCELAAAAIVRHSEIGPHGLTIDDVANASEINIVGSIGADVLGFFDLEFDVVGRTLAFSPCKVQRSFDSTVHFRSLSGIPIIDATIGNLQGQYVVRTAARISYCEAAPKFPRLAESVPDFIPTFGGPFRADLHAVPVVVAGQLLELGCAALPSRIGTASCGTDGIIGSELFLKCRVAYYPRSQQLRICPYTRA